MKAHLRPLEISKENVSADQSLMARNKKQFRVLLVSLFNDEALNIRLLHSIVHNKGYDARMLFLKKFPIRNQKGNEYLKKSFIHEPNKLTDKELELFADFILGYKPHIIAFSLVSSNFSLYKKIYDKVRPLGDFIILIGGWQASLNPEHTIQYCDALCIGEGEEAISEIVDNLFTHQPIDHVQNLWVNKNGAIIKNNVRNLINDLNKNPIPVFDNEKVYSIDDDNLFHEEPFINNVRYAIMASRGCPYRCTYCSNEYMANKIYGLKWSATRYRSVDSILSELAMVKNKFPKIERIDFLDEVFIPNKTWMKEFCARYPEEIGLPFYCFFYPGTCLDETAELLKKSMLHGVWLGVQSGSEKIRKKVFKRFYTNTTVLKQAHIFNKHNINVKYDFIFDNPFETFEDSMETIKLILEFPQPFSLNLFSLKYFPKTEISSMALKRGFISAKNIDDSYKPMTDVQYYKVNIHGRDKNVSFINRLAMYISFLALDAKIYKKDIDEIIDRYHHDGDLDYITKLLNLHLA